MNTNYAQNLKTHKWENRLLLVITDDTNNEIYKNQITELEHHVNGLKERKLIVYHIKKNSYKIGLNENNSWQESNKLYQAYKKTNTPFEILLVGLDGGIKLKQNKMLSSKDLFSVIDVMPMRKAELKKQGN